MPLPARYVHTNLIARDWRRLADFYTDVFGCAQIGPERDHHGPSTDAGTGISGARVRGAHLRLPGYGDNGPTLEIFEYHPAADPLPPRIDRPGFAHLAFRVDDVAIAREAVLAAGGRDYGQMVSSTVPGAGIVTYVYLCDPEGNIIELQSWRPEPGGTI